MPIDVSKACLPLGWQAFRHFSRISPPFAASAVPVICVSNNISRLSNPKESKKARQLLLLPPFPTNPEPLLGRRTSCNPEKPNEAACVSAITWVKYYLADIPAHVIQQHFNKGLVQVENSNPDGFSNGEGRLHFLRKIKYNEAMREGMKVYIPVSAAETEISKRYDTIPRATLYPNADEIEYLQRLVIYKDSAMLVLNKPPKLPVKGNMSVHNSMDALAAAALSYGCKEVPMLIPLGREFLSFIFSGIFCVEIEENNIGKRLNFLFFMERELDDGGFEFAGGSVVHFYLSVLARQRTDVGQTVHKFDRESSGILLMGRTKESIASLHSLFNDKTKGKTSFESWNDASKATTQTYWALVIGSPKEKQGVINAPLSKVCLNDGQTERVILAHPSGIDGQQEAISEYRVLGPTINGCSWVELRPLTSRKHQLRVHCAEALGTPIVGDYKYGWYAHCRWRQTNRADYEPVTGESYKLRRPQGLAVQKGSVLSKVPLLHLHFRELVLPNVSKFLQVPDSQQHFLDSPKKSSKLDLLRFVAPMPSHMKISWNLMSSYLV